MDVPKSIHGMVVQSPLVILQLLSQLKEASVSTTGTSSCFLEELFKYLVDRHDFRKFLHSFVAIPVGLRPLSSVYAKLRRTLVHRNCTACIRNV